jgi:hypothetical protein
MDEPPLLIDSTPVHMEALPLPCFRFDMGT